MEEEFNLSEEEYHVLTCDECICECCVKQNFKYPKLFGVEYSKEECFCQKDEK